ncbi:hypothetical protein QNI16_21695 [Cytophagaceae bacterium YF14B1]|uniref:PAS domain-containing protein n=1 Tax=Xanthocytophaga flava TaxID=3048013 RepID=A0AAE3QPM0_9BACT|nr:hypothetical protein [Xanthocytophaga flavus]MDJ1483127.1 hypothetical protein [Xanthocytophaga flavus]
MTEAAPIALIDETPAEWVYEYVTGNDSVYIIKNKRTGLISFAPESVARLLGFESTEILMQSFSL